MTQKASPLSIGLAVTLLITAVSGGMYMGALASDVEHLEQVEEQRQEDHDTIVTQTADLKTLKEDMTATKETLAAMLTVLNKIEQKVE